MGSKGPHPGLDLARLGEWLPSVLSDAGSGLSATLIAGGKSHLTYEVTDGAQSWIVRRPPVGHLLATAHDMAREYRVMAALQDTAVPVPRTLGLCSDDEVLGAPFYVMERVDGRPYRLSTRSSISAPRARAPAEKVYEDQLAQLDDTWAWDTAPIMLELRAEARRRGLWNLFLPGEHGAGLTNLQYTPLHHHNEPPTAPSRHHNCLRPSRSDGGWLADVTG